MGQVKGNSTHANLNRDLGTKPVMIGADTTLNTVIDSTFATDADKNTTNAKLDALSPFAAITGSCANDTAAASAGVPVGGLYHTSGAIKVRLV